MACRLARFNAGVDFNANSATKSFFMGVPAPAGAMLVVLPLVCSFHFGNTFFSDPNILIPYTLFVAFLLVSRIPTFSSKMINNKNLSKLGILRIPTIIIVLGTGFTMTFLSPWFAVIVVSTLYIISFPISYLIFIMLSNSKEQ